MGAIVKLILKIFHNTLQDLYEGNKPSNFLFGICSLVIFEPIQDMIIKVCNFTSKFVGFFTDTNFLHKQVSELKYDDNAMLGVKLALWSPAYILGQLLGLAPKDPTKDTPLHIAARKGDYTCMELLARQLRVCRLVDAKNALGQTPLFISAKRLERMHVNLLLDYGADVNAVDHTNKTCLHYLLEIDLFYLTRHEIIKLLMIIETLLAQKIDVSIVSLEQLSCRQMLENRVKELGENYQSVIYSTDLIGDDILNIKSTDPKTIGRIFARFLQGIRARELKTLLEMRGNKNSLFYKAHLCEDMFGLIVKLL